MDYQRQAIDIIWNKLGVDILLSNWYSPDYREENLLKNRFSRYLVDCYKELTLDQASAIEKLVCQKWMQCPTGEKSGDKNIFNVLLHFVENVIVEENGEPKCQFKHLLRWWNISQLVDSNLLVCAYLANKDIQQNFDRFDFAWSPVLKHTNRVLDEMLNRGVSELHFHLKGSSLNFDIQWLSLMNDVFGRKKMFKNMRYAQCAVLLEEPENIRNSSLYEQMLLAAYIRTFLYKVCVKGEEDDDFSRNKIDNILCAISDVQNRICENRYSSYRYKKNVTDIGKIIDYAIPSVLTLNESETIRFVNSILHGERLILYKSLRFIYGNNETSCKDYGLVKFALLAYTMIKSRFRQELLQINERKGFDNFCNYEQRKEIFIKDGSVYSELIKDVAIKNTCCNQPIEYLEYRIAPKDDEQDLLNELNLLNNLDRKTYFNNEEIQNKMSSVEKYIVSHFIKVSEKKIDGNLFLPRNNSLRRKVKKQSFVIRKIFSSSSLAREMICGFDAANAERNARPEVFAQAFRYLRGELYFKQNNFIKKEKLHSLGMTYHVGEDFWDIVDGLRAIDEAILFLNLREGDRLGHALSLGVNVCEYYAKRHSYVVMPRQVFLDNMVWLYFKAQSYNVFIPPALVGYISNKVEEYSRLIYGESKKIIDLYNAWLLRGDDPLVEKNNKSILGWGAYAYNNILPNLKDLRSNSDIKELFRSYHENQSEGDVMCTEKLDSTIFSVIEQIQNKMCFDVEQKHIGIETNLTSNLRIGEFNRFDEHPILKYNRDGLSGERCLNSIMVSINTDDQGIFGTSIINEFALMALAMEKMKDEDGNLIYRSSEIINWLDNIRKIAISQRFVGRGETIKT